VRSRQPAFDHGDGPLLDEPGESRNEIVAAAEIDAIGQPNKLDLGRGGEETAERRQRVRPLDCVGLGIDLLETHARRRWQLERDVAGRLGQRDQRDAATIRFRARDQVLRHSHARVPAGRGGKAVVDQERERRLAARGRGRRIPQRPGGGDDHQRGKHQAQQREPPRRALRRLLARSDVEQEPRRREFDPPGLRRNKAQQPPQHGQAQQREQDQRLRETEREPRDHRSAPELRTAGATGLMRASRLAR
jgi:hypothetical protein